MQHLAYEDMCFVAEKDGERRDVVFDDEKGLSWSAFLAAALKPVEVAICASKILSTADVQQHDAACAARELRYVCLCLAGLVLSSRLTPRAWRLSLAR